MTRLRRRERTELKNTAYEIFIAALSLLSIVNLALILVYASDAAMQLVLAAMNALFSVIFLADFIYRLVTTPSRSAYFFRHFGWADLLASLPFPHAKVLRIFRLVRVFRLMSALGPRRVWQHLVHDRANSTLMTLLFLGVLVVEIGSLSILSVEDHAPGANITSASDALWYTIVTISTVGYGDRYPVTIDGRLIGTIIIIVGVGIFGTFTGYLANLFLGPRVSESRATSTSDDDRASAAAAGVAGGAASGAVMTGMDAAGPAADEISSASEADLAHVRELLAKAENALAELRAALAARDSGR